MRYDIFLRKAEGWELYVGAVLKSCSKPMVDALEQQGETVGVFVAGRVVGRMVYQSGEVPNG